MKKIFLSILLFIAIITMSSCGGGREPYFPPVASYTKQDTSRDVDLPTEYPKYDEDCVMIHYHRNNNKYSQWALWLWPANKEGSQYDFNYMDDNGVIAYYKLSELGTDSSTNLGLIVKGKESWDKDVSDDRFIDFSVFEKDSNNIYHVYLFTGDAEMYSSVEKTVSDKISSASFTKYTEVSVKTSNPVNHYGLYDGENLIKEEDVTSTNSITITLSESDKFEFGKDYKVKVRFTESGSELTSGITFTTLYNSDFDRDYYYEGELGAIYSQQSTEFKVWSPASNKIVLKIYENGTPSALSKTLGSDVVFKEEVMTRGEKGVFSKTVNGDLEGKYYTYTVYNASFPEGKEIVDPYAKSTGVNGQRGMIVDFSKTNPDGWNNVSALQIDRKHLTVYELHVADLTSSTTWTGTEANRKKYLGLQEEGTTYTANGKTVTTGFDHIKELGVNAVQLLPIFDQANDEVNPTFNWGYNPLNYNALEGSYSSNPYDGYERIKEFKQVVKAYNEAGINIIMDVVYNHTNSVNGTNFDVLMPGYYFRYNANGTLYNGSGCGNETASDHSMFRKFMIDSTKFWLSEYKLGGFRFDLMGLHDIETMNKLAAACQEINPSVTIYGEPWTGGTSGLDGSKQAKQDNEANFVGYGAFNDKIRDELIKGGLSSASAKSWISNTTSSLATNFDNLFNGIKGITINASNGPDKSLTYATCHDNYTLYDRFKAAGITDEDTVKKMAMLANSIVFTSQGTSFMLSGEEFLRTKGGNSNSYNASYQVNELNYALKIKNFDMFENYKKLIALKQQCQGLHLGTDQASQLNIGQSSNNSIIEYSLVDSVNNREYKIIHKNGVSAEGDVKTYNLTGYTLYLDTLGREDLSLSNFTLNDFETIIAYKEL